LHSRRGHWLNLVNPHFHLHVDLARVAGLWFYSREHRQHGVYFLDEAGDAVFSLLLVKLGEDFDAAALSRFHQSCERYGQPFVPVDEAPEPETETDE